MRALQSTDTVGAVAADVPGAARVFGKLGIDFCCGGKKSLAEACAQAGISLDALCDALDHVETDDADTAAAKGPLGELVRHIVAHYHDSEREELERLRALLTKVCSVHGARHPELARVRALWEPLREELITHMRKEELVLFPYVSALDSTPRPRAPFGSVQNPVRMMSSEHEGIGEVLRRLRAETRDFTPPDDACASYRALYSGLADFETHLHAHMALENNVLFPRAIAAERA
jgi:regulator of cell morphogenesis and NO signaling